MKTYNFKINGKDYSVNIADIENNKAQMKSNSIWLA